MDNPASHQFHVTAQYAGRANAKLDLKMPVWTPGYYQIMDYAKAVTNFTATDAQGNSYGRKQEAVPGRLPLDQVKQ